MTQWLAQILAGPARVEQPTTQQPTAAQATPRAAWRVLRAVWPLAFFLALALAMTFPLVLNLSSSIIRHPVISRSVDIDTERWALWWFKTAVTERHSNPLYTDMLYYPYRSSDNPLPLYLNDNHPLDMFIGMPIVLLSDPASGPTLAYNLLLLFHLTFTGFAMFLLARRLSRSTVGGLLAGVLFTYCPLSQYQIQAGHLVLMAMGWMLLHILFIHRLLYPRAGEHPGRADLALAALLLLATSLTNWYLTMFLLVIDGLLTLVALLERRAEWRPTLARALLVLGGWLVLVSPFLIATIRSIGDVGFNLSAGLDYEVSLSFSPLEFVTITKDYRFDPAGWMPGFLGYTALILGAIGAWRAKGRRAPWLVLIGAGCILALGPYLHLNIDAKEVSATSEIPLPYLILRSLPFVSISRAPRRFVLLADLGLAALSAYGAAYLMTALRGLYRRWRGGAMPQLARAGTTALLVALPLLELATVPQPVAQVYVSPFFTQLAQDPDEYGILELPVTTHYARDHDRMFNQTLHHKRIIGGYLSRWVEDYYHRPDSPFNAIANQTATSKPDIVPRLSHLALLNYYDIRYVLLYKESIAYERPSDREAAQKYARALFPDPAAQVFEDQQLTAFKVPQVPQRPLLWVGDGWYPQEAQPGHIWRWSKGQSSLYIASKQPQTISIKFITATLKEEGNFDLLLNGQPVKQLRIGPTDTAVDSGLLQLPAGQNELTFRSDVPAITPAQAGFPGNDDRTLSFVIRDVQFTGLPDVPDAP